MAKAQSSGPVQLSGIDLSAIEHGSSLEGLVVQSQTQVSVSAHVFVCLSVSIILSFLCIDLVKDTNVKVKLFEVEHETFITYDQCSIKCNS